MTTTLPVSRYHFEELSSTNDFANQLIRDGHASEGDVITADFQLSGRGQYGRVWDSVKGENLLSSWILKPDFLAIEDQFLLSAAVALAVSDTLTTFLDQPSQVKWPNDVIYHGKKLSGILIQNSLQQKKFDLSVIGIGININQTKFDSSAPYATSLRQLLAYELDKELVFNELAQNLGRRYHLLKLSPSTILEDYKQRMFGFGRLVNVLLDDRHQKVFVEDIFPSGRLTILVGGHERECDFGELRFIYGE